MAHSLELFVSVLEKNIDNRGKTPPLSPTGYPLIEVKHIQEDRLYPVFEDTKYVDQETWDTWFRAHLKPGDILFSTVGSIARSCMVPEKPKFCIAQNVLGFRVNRAKADPRFLYYAINDSFFQHEVHGRTIETVQKSIKVYDLKTCRIPLPPLAEQKAIAAVLGALDDKIELNRRMNATLEAMARALFQSWFVDFDPVRQNMDAKPAPSPIPEAANLPAGEAGGKWLTYAIECQGGSLYIGQTDNLRRRWKQHVDGKGAEWTKAHPPVALVFWETHDSLEAAVAREAKLKSGSGREWLKQKIAERTSVRLPAGEAGAKLDGRPPAALDPATAALFPEHLEDSPLGHIPKGWKAGTVVEGFNLTMGQSPPGDTYNEDGNGLPFYQGRTDFGFRFPTRRIYCSAPTRYAKPGDTLVSVRAPVGDINMANEECCIGRGVAAVRHKSGATSFTYHSMANLYPEFARFEAEGTVFGSINKDSFEKLPFVIPPAEIIVAYERQAGPLDEQIRTLENQSRTLATLRDTLLPKLLSGELKTAAASANVTVSA